MPKKDEARTEERKAERADQPVRATDEQRDDGTITATEGSLGDEAVGMSEEGREAVDRGLERNRKALTVLAKW